MVYNGAGNGENIKLCKNCGISIDPGMKFCIACGTPVPEDELVHENESALAEALPEPKQEDLEEYAPIQPVYDENEPVYQAESYAPTADLPFPDVPETCRVARSRQIPSKKEGVFTKGFLGLAVMAALIIAAIAAGYFSREFMMPQNLNALLVQLLMYGCIAFAAVITSRAKGPDISIGAVMALAATLSVSFSGLWIFGIVITLLICAAIGALNGMFIVYLKVPALLLTLVTAFILRGVFALLSDFSVATSSAISNLLYSIRSGSIEIVPLAVAGAAFLLAFLLVVFSNLGKPLSKREAADSKRFSNFLAYLFSSVIACAAGIMYLPRLGLEPFVSGMGSEMFIIFIFAAVTSSLYLDNRGAPVLYSVAAVFMYVLAQNVLLLFNIYTGFIQIISGVVVLVFIAISYIARKDSFKDLVQRI